ncbi:MAG: TonB-dependent receptor, partial [Thermoanaerobaculia bacterium]
HLDGEVSSGSYATRSASFSAAKKLTERFAIGVDASIFDSAGYDRVPDSVRGPVDTPTPSDNSTVQLRSEFATDHTRSFVRGRFFTENQSQGTPESKNSRDIFDLSAGTHVAIGTGDLSATLFHENQEFWVQNTSLIRRDSEFILNRRTTPIHDTGAAFQWSQSPGRRVSFLTVGLDLREISLNEHGLNYNSIGDLTLIQDVGGTQDFAGLFGEATFVITPRLEAFTSARVDWWKNRDGFDERSVGADTQYPSKSTTQLDPRIALRYAMSPSTSLRGAVYRAFRAPTISELYRKTEAKAQVNLPNPDLGPETLIGGDVGVDARIAGTDASINVFYNEIDGLIGRIPLQVTPVLTQLTVNVGKTRSQGVEAMASRDLSPRWAMKMGLELTDAITVSNPADPTLEGRRTPGVSKHVETLSVRYQRENGFAVTVRGRQVGKRYVDAANALELDGHAVVDLFASMPISRSAELFLIGENLLNEVYLADVGAAQRLGAPPQVFGGVRMRVRRAHD